MFDQGRVSISADMGFEAVNGGFPLCFTQRTSASSSLADAMLVASTSVRVVTVTALLHELRSDAFECPIKLVRDQQPAKTDNGGSFGCRLIRSEPAETTEGGAIVQSLGQLDLR